MSAIDVSVITPVYDTGDLLLETIDSLLGQVARPRDPLPSYEVLVIDDSSSDVKTREIVEGLKRRDPRIRVLSNGRTKGVSGARNTGIEAARGQWIAFCDSDDLWLPHCLADRWAAIRADPDITWLATPFLRMRWGKVEELSFRQRSPRLYRLIAESYDRGEVAKLERAVTALLRFGCGPPVSYMAAKPLIAGRGGFDETMHRSEDYLLWLRLGVVSDLHFLPQDTAVYRLRPGSTVHDENLSFDLEDDFEDVMLDKLRRDPEFQPFIPEIRDRMARVLTAYCYFFRSKGNWSKAGDAALRLLREQPMQWRSWKHCLAALLRAS